MIRYGKIVDIVNVWYSLDLDRLKVHVFGNVKNVMILRRVKSECTLKS